MPDSPQEDSPEPLIDNDSVINTSARQLDSHHPFRRLFIFQIKLALDALRDILLSPVSLICTILDLIEKKKGADSYFEKLMLFGRQTERRINLFEQHRDEHKTVDSMMGQVEEVLVKEYKNKNISKKTLASIQNILNKDNN